MQTVRRDRESVPALVERAREVINRRMEKAPQNNWHSSFQRLYEPQTPGQSGWQQQSSDQRMASPEPMVCFKRSTAACRLCTSVSVHWLVHVLII